MDIGQAVAVLKRGGKVARAGWNGKDMWLAYSPGGMVSTADFWASANKAYAATLGGSAPVLPCITMRTASGEVLMGWLASQTDLLATDWEEVA